MRNGPNPEIGRSVKGHAAAGGERSLLLGFAVLPGALKFCKRIERAEELAGNGCVVPKEHLPAVGGPGHEGNADGFMRVQMLRAILDDSPCVDALSVGSDGQHAGLDAPRTQAAPVRLSKADHKRVFGDVLRGEGFAEAAQEFIVFVLVLLGEDDERL